MAHRRGVGEAQALDEEDRLAVGDAEATGERRIGLAAVEAQQPRRRREPVLAGHLREAERGRRAVQIELAPGHVDAASAHDVEQPFLAQHQHRVARGHAADAVPCGELGFGGRRGIRAPAPARPVGAPRGPSDTGYAGRDGSRPRCMRRAGRRVYAFSRPLASARRGHRSRRWSARRHQGCRRRAARRHRPPSPVRGAGAAGDDCPASRMPRAITAAAAYAGRDAAGRRRRWIASGRPRLRAHVGQRRHVDAEPVVRRLQPAAGAQRVQGRSALPARRGERRAEPEPVVDAGPRRIHAGRPAGATSSARSRACATPSRTSTTWWRRRSASATRSATRRRWPCSSTPASA